MYYIESFNRENILSYSLPHKLSDEMYRMNVDFLKYLELLFNYLLILFLVFLKI